MMNAGAEEFLIEKLADARVVPVLISMLADKRGSDPINHRAIYIACRALGAVGEPAVQPLIELLQNERYNPKYRGEIVHALGLTKSLTAVQPLIEVLQNERYNPEYRGEVAYALGLTKSLTAFQPLLKVLEDQRANFWVRRGAMTGLCLLRDRVGFEEVRVKQALTNALQDPNFNIAREARGYLKMLASG